MNSIWKGITWLGSLATLAPMLVFAQSGGANLGDVNVTAPGDVSALLSIVCRIINYVFFVLIIVAIIFVIIAAFRYLTSGGESEAVSKANKMLIYAAVAVAVALLAKAVPVIVGSIVGGSGEGLNPCGSTISTT